MGSSLGFGSAPRHLTPCSDSLSLRLRPLTTLTWRDAEQLAGSFFNRHAVTPPSQGGSDCLGAHGFRIFSSPSRGAFHLSLTVLVHYRSPGVFSLGGWSPQLPTGFHVPRGTQVPSKRRRARVAYGAVTPSGRPSQAVRLRAGLVDRRGHCGDLHWVLQPPVRNARRLGTHRVWAAPRSLTTTWGISVDVFSSRY